MTLREQELRAALHDAVRELPAQPDRLTPVFQRHRQARLRRVVGGGLGAALVLSVGGVAASGAGLSSDRSEQLAIAPAVGPAWTDAYIRWQAGSPDNHPDLVQRAWQAWSGSDTAAPPELKPIAVHPGVTFANVIFQVPGQLAAEKADGLRLVSVYLGKAVAAVGEDVAAPPPDAVRALAVLAQGNPDGTWRSRPAAGDTSAPPPETWNAMHVYVDPATVDPHFRVTAPAATEGDGIHIDDFQDDEVTLFLGPNGRGPVPARLIDLTIFDRETVLFRGVPGLPG